MNARDDRAFARSLHEAGAKMLLQRMLGLLLCLLLFCLVRFFDGSALGGHTVSSPNVSTVPLDGGQAGPREDTTRITAKLLGQR